jgi:hypothetical protein
MEEECDIVSGLTLTAQRLQMRVRLRPQCREEVVVADQLLLRCCLLHPAREKGEVAIDHGLAMFLCKEREISRESEMRKFRWQRTRDTSKEFVTVEVRTPIAPHMQFVQTERKKEASDDLTQTFEREGRIMSEAGGDEVDIVMTELMGVGVSVLQEEAQHGALCMVIEEPTGFLRSDIQLDVLLVVKCDDDLSLLDPRLLPLVFCVQLFFEDAVMMIEADRCEENRGGVPVGLSDTNAGAGRKVRGGGYRRRYGAA